MNKLCVTLCFSVLLCDSSNFFFSYTESHRVNTESHREKIICFFLLRKLLNSDIPEFYKRPMTQKTYMTGFIL